MLTAGRGQLRLHEALGTEGGAEYLREGRCQLTGSGRQLQSSVKMDRGAKIQC